MMDRRRALMGQQSNKTLFEWDYTEGMSPKIVSVSAINPTMAADGLLLSGGPDAWSACAIAPNIDPLTQSYKATISYTNINSEASDSSVGFWHYNNYAKRIRLFKQKKGGNNVTNFVNASNTQTQIPWVLYNSGDIVIKYDAVANKIKYTQGTKTYEASIDTPSEPTFSARLVNAQKGSSVNASVKITHIKIEAV